MTRALRHERDINRHSIPMRLFVVGALLSGVQDRWLVSIPGKERARYIKLGLREKQYLDLKYVFVYRSARGPASR